MANKRVGDFEVSGSKDLISFLSAFGPKIERKMLDQSVSAAVRQGLATPIKKKIRSVVKKRSGNLLKGVKVKKIKGVTPGSYRVFMGPPAYHAHLVEYGTVTHRQATKNKGTANKSRVVKFSEDNFRMVSQTGHMPAAPFFRPAVTENKQKAADVLKKQLLTRIDKYIATQKPR